MTPALAHHAVPETFEPAHGFAARDNRQPRHGLHRHRVEADLARGVIFQNFSHVRFVPDEVDDFANVSQRLIEGLALRIAPGKHRALDDVSAVFITFHNKRECAWHHSQRTVERYILQELPPMATYLMKSFHWRV